MIDTLALRDNAKSQLLKITSVESGIDYLNKLKAIGHWVKAERRDSELQNIVAEQKIRTQRILGRLIREGQKRNEIAKKGESGKILITDEEKEKKKLSDLGISANQSSTFQKISSIPEETFEEAIAKNKKAVEDATFELTTAGFVKLANQLNPGSRPHRDDKVDSFDKQKLIDLRAKFKISQYELALETQIESSMISRLESGEAERPSFDVVARISEFFSVQMEDFKIGKLL